MTCCDVSRLSQWPDLKFASNVNADRSDEQIQAPANFLYSCVFIIQSRKLQTAHCTEKECMESSLSTNSPYVFVHVQADSSSAFF